MKAKLKAILANLITLSSNGKVRKLKFKKVPGKGYSIDINPATAEPQDVRTALEDIKWGMIYNGEASLYNGKIQSPSITIGPVECIGSSNSTSDLDELMDFLD
jgi:hypothetical protein